MKNFSDTIGNRTLDLPTCSGVPQPTALPRAPILNDVSFEIPQGAWMFVCCECCVLSGRGLCDELITRREESYRLCCVVLCDLGTS